MDISTLSEFELIARLTSGFSARSDVPLGIGDDCAVLDLGSEVHLLVTCDSQVEDVHFTLKTSRSEQIGRKALAINLSDIAAMGGEPRFALVSLIVPAQFPIDIMENIYAGLRQEAEDFGTAIVGGNISGAGVSTQLVIDITVLGTVERGRALRRDGAQVGDLICVTGGLGDSAAGFYTLAHPLFAFPEEAQAIVQAIHCVPRPRVAEARALGRLGPQTVTALLDVSDGLSGDLAHLCERSKVGARLSSDLLPLSPSMQSIASVAGKDPLQWALHGGEDYELLFTVAPDQITAVRDAVYQSTGTAVTVIGNIRPLHEGMTICYSDGREESLVVRSWDHLKQ